MNGNLGGGRRSAAKCAAAHQRRRSWSRRRSPNVGSGRQGQDFEDL